MNGKFLTIEGTEGVGKSTNLHFIAGLLRQRGIDVLVTREPGGTPLAEEIRELLLANREERVDPMAELLLVFAARAQHLHQVIAPAINAGKWVLSDRFTDATYAYQGCGRQLPLDAILELERLVQGDIHPDATFYLDIEIQVGLARAKARGDFDRFEAETLDFFERVRQGYLDRVATDPARYFLIDAGRELDAVQRDIAAVVSRLFES